MTALNHFLSAFRNDANVAYPATAIWRLASFSTVHGSFKNDPQQFLGRILESLITRLVDRLVYGLCVF